MKTRIETIVKTLYVSDVTGFETESEDYARVIEWADVNPHAWRIVAETKSIAWGKGSNAYLGTCRDSSQPWAILMRLALFKRYVVEAAEPRKDIRAENALFALQNYDARGYAGGFFRQHDGKYERACLDLDYTRETLESWIDRFVTWAEANPAGHVTDHILLNGNVVREGCRHPTKTAKDGKVTCNVCQKVVQTLW